MNVITKFAKYSLSALLAATCSSVYLAPAHAQSAATCFQSPAKLSDDAVQSFLTNPSALLTENPTGGLALSSRVRALAGSSSATLDPIKAQVAAANSAQKSAIGSGLARAARACAPVQPEYAALIQQMVAELNSPEVTAAFLAASNEVQTAALGGAGAATGGGGGGGAIGGTGSGGGSGGGSGSVGGSSSVGQSGGGFSSGGGGSYSAGDDDTGSTTTIISPSL